jgi:UMP-CMP kinase
MLRYSRRVLNTTLWAAQQRPATTRAAVSSTTNNGILRCTSAAAVAAAALYYTATDISSSNCTSLWGSTDVSPISSLDVEPITPKVVFVLGGPGAGKGTQCAKIVKVSERIHVGAVLFTPMLNQEYGFVHLSAGDLLRAERASGSKVGPLVLFPLGYSSLWPLALFLEWRHDQRAHQERRDRTGTDYSWPAEEGDGGEWRRCSGTQHSYILMPVPPELFLIDGFPRNFDNLDGWNECMGHCRVECVLFYECSEEAMASRIMQRGETSGRVDDNPEALRKRSVACYCYDIPW